ncbi:hypothetical protein Bca101_046916 [Brassica carinata]
MGLETKRRLRMGFDWSASPGVCCNGAGTTNVFSTSSPPKVQDHRSVQFWWFLPHRFPVPASGPSRRHNDIGLSTTSTRSSP